MAKWLALLLLLITTAGSFIPCCPEDECNEEKLASSSQRDSEQKDSHCSPFFACGTCPGFAGAEKVYYFIQPLPEEAKHMEQVVAFHLSSYASSFWQPPRLV